MLVQAYRQRGRDVLIGWFVGMCWQSAQVAAPLVIAAAVDQGLVAGDTRALARWVACLAVLCFVEVALTALRHRFAIIPAVQVSIRLREDVLARVHCAVPRRGRASGDIVSRATFDVDSISGLVDFTPSTIACAVSTLAVGTILGALDPALAAAAFVPLLPVAVLYWWWSGKYQNAIADEQAAVGELSASAEIAIDQSRVISGIGAPTALAMRWSALVEQARRAGIRTGRVRASFVPVLEMLQTVALVSVLMVGVSLVDDGRIGVGQLLAAASYTLFLGPVLAQLGAFVAEVRAALAAASRLTVAVVPGRSDTDRMVEVDLPPASPEGRRLQITGLVVDGTCLRGVDIDVLPGSLVAVIGGSGSELETLGRVLDGRLTPDAGTIALDGVDVTDYPHRALVNEIRVVERDAFLFSGELRDALTFGRPESGAASDADLDAALSRAAARSVADALPDGLGSELSVGATNLSGGQRQRVALTQALLTDPPVLVCVDATAALDAGTATLVLEGFRERGRTVVLLTSDPDVAAHADIRITLALPDSSDSDESP